MTKARNLAKLISDNMVGTAEIDDGAVTTAKLADDAVTPAKLNVNGADIPYDNSVSGISATTLQAAIDYLNVLSGGGSAGAQATYTREEFTATAGQTTFTTANGYTLGYLQVFMNGIMLDSGDYTANDESTVVLGAGAAANDEVTTIAYDSFAISEVLRVMNISASSNTNSIEVKSDSALKVNTPASMALEVNSANTANYIGFSKSNTAWAWIGDGSSGSDKFTIATYTNEPIAFFTGGSERVQVTSDGYVTTPYQPAFFARLSAQWTHPSGVVQLGGSWVADLNVGSCYNTATRRFTAPVAGKYQFNTTVGTIGGVTGVVYISSELWVNGSRTYVGSWDSGGSSYNKSSASYIVALNANDYVTIGSEISLSAVLQDSSHNTFSGYLIG